ncbi:hypothetical protein [Pedobacter sp. JCM 36344]
MKQPTKKSTTTKKVTVRKKKAPPDPIETSGDDNFDNAIDLFLKKPK